MKKIVSIGFANFEDYQNKRGCVCWTICDTVKEAKEKAKYYLTEQFNLECDGKPLSYSQVVVNGEVIYDYFAK